MLFRAIVALPLASVAFPLAIVALPLVTVAAPRVAGIPIATRPVPGNLARHGVALGPIDSLLALNQADSALAMIERRLREPETEADPVFMRSLRMRQGGILASMGFAKRGEEVLRPVLSDAWSAGDSATVCAALRWLSLAVASQGRGDEAASLSRDLLSIARLRGDCRYEGWARVGLAWDEETRGNPKGAAEEYRRAIDRFSAGGEVRGEAWARNGLGNALSRTGLHEEARSAYETAVALSRRSGYRMVECLATNNLGTLEYMLGDPASAVERFREASRLHREIGNVRESMIPGINLALCEADLGRTGAAVESLESMLELCRKESYRDLEAMVRLHLAGTRKVEGRAHEARRLFRSILNDPMAPSKVRLDAATGLAGSMVEAESCLAAIDLLQRTLERADSKADPKRLLRLEQTAGLMFLECSRAQQALPLLVRAEASAARLGLREDRLDALVAIGRAWIALARPDSARAALEKAAAVWETQRGIPSDPEWREQRGNSGRWLCTDLVSLILEGEGDRPDRLGEAYQRAQTFKARTLLERMSGPAVVIPDSGSRLPLVTLQRDCLREGEILLDFFVGPSRSFLFAVTRDSLRAIELPSEEEIGAAARLYSDLLAEPDVRADSRAVLEAGYRLGDRIFAGTEDLLRDAHAVLVAPDGLLNLVPLPLLRRDGGTGVEWTTIPSASVLARIRARPQRTEPASRILALGAETAPFTRLRGTREEVDHLADRYDDVDDRILGSADRVDMRDLSAGSLVLHIAAHAEIDDQRPWLSSLHLGSEGLRAGEIAQARVRARLAVLSSCRTASGRILSGEGVLGLSTALLSAGTDCVVASLWPVDDRVTARLMRHFYASLSEGNTVVAALQWAQGRIRDDAETRHPFFWAGFIAMGAGDSRIPLSVRTDPLGGLFPGFACAAIAGGIAFLLLIARGRRGTRRVETSVIRSPRERPMG